MARVVAKRGHSQYGAPVGVVARRIAWRGHNVTNSVRDLVGPRNDVVDPAIIDAASAALRLVTLARSATEDTGSRPIQERALPDRDALDLNSRVRRIPAAARWRRHASFSSTSSSTTRTTSRTRMRWVPYS